MQVCSSVEGFKDVSNLLCVWVEAVYTKEQRLAIGTFDGVIIFLVYLHPFKGLHECSFFFIVRTREFAPFFLDGLNHNGLAAVPVVITAAAAPPSFVPPLQEPSVLFLCCTGL